MAELKIEAGKFYRTRGGQKAFVAGVLLSWPEKRSPSYPVAGYVEGRHGEDRWLTCGHSATLAHLDLVEEWKEPHSQTIYISLWLNTASNATYVSWEDKAFPREYPLLGWRRIATKTVTITEGEGMP